MPRRAPTRPAEPQSTRRPGENTPPVPAGAVLEASLIVAGRVLPAVEGDAVPALLRPHLSLGAVVPACGAEPYRWACLSCGQWLATPYQLDAHTQHGTHVIARGCGSHGPFYRAEVLPYDSQPIVLASGASV
jgi:hypothetical protein